MGPGEDHRILLLSPLKTIGVLEFAPTLEADQICSRSPEARALCLRAVASTCRAAHALSEALNEALNEQGRCPKQIFIVCDLRQAMTEQIHMHTPSKAQQ
eukprot:7236342-Alexandrium_andersonii.AAC.2